ncbi:serpin B4-like [Mercenaria mercenaria]|uniref:serpin B4-like n=1 Tax=Mercenaria mercenaria TaxID=6596 RepID=UPI00234E584F|nr:serpin B4-like [Mercenaria mercenaria]
MSESSQIVQGLTGFSWDLYRAASQKGENFLISPHSVCSALMLACLGAKGNTAAQIFKTLGMCDTASDEYHTAYSGLNENLKKLSNESDGVSLNVANKLFAGNVMKVLEKYVQEAKKLYTSGIETMDFACKPEESRQLINKWVEEQTNDKIKDLLKEGTVGPGTKLVLANAVYFKGKWDKPFKQEKTESTDFHVSSAVSVKVEMMREKFDLRYVRNEEEKFSAVVVPYQNNYFSMAVVRPDDVEGLSQIEESLNSDKVVSLVADIRQSMKCKVDIGLPKFAFSQASDLTRILPKLGVEDLFDPAKSDLSAMTDTSDVAISDVIHKAFIDVNEEGTEAAAATAMISRMMAMPMGEIQFICDRPFLFMMIENQSGHIFFIGRYAKP